MRCWLSWRPCAPRRRRGRERQRHQAVPLQKGAGGVGPVDLEALVLGAVPLDQPDVVEHRADVQQLGVVLEAEPFAP
jgi:hypothetical protein